MYEWEIPEEYVKIFSVDKESGIIRGNETVQLQWNFAPKNKRSYLIRISCKVYTAEVNVNSEISDANQQVIAHISPF